jgi:hypothetical protein
MEMFQESRAPGGVLLRGATVAACGPERRYRVDSRSNKCNVITPKLTGYEFWDDDKAKKFAV